MRTVYPLLVAAALVLSSSAAAIDQLVSKDDLSDCEACVNGGVTNDGRYANINKRQSDLDYDGGYVNTDTGNVNNNDNSGIRAIDPADLNVNYDGGYVNTNTGNSNLNNNNNNNNNDGVRSIDPAQLDVNYGDDLDFDDAQGSGGTPNQPVNQPANQPMNQPVNRPVNQPGIQPINQPANQPGIRPINQPLNRPLNRPANRPFNQPGNQPVNQPVNRPGNQPVNQPGTNRGNRPNREPGLRDTTQIIDEQTPPVSTNDDMQYDDPNVPTYDRNRPGAQLVDGRPVPQGRVPNRNQRMPFPGNPDSRGNDYPIPGGSDLDYDDGSDGGFDPMDNTGYPPPGNEGFPNSAQTDLDFPDGAAPNGRDYPNIPFDNKDFSSGDPGYPNHPRPLNDLTTEIGDGPPRSRNRSGEPCRRRNPSGDHDYDFIDPTSDDIYEDPYCDPDDYLSDDDLVFDEACDADGYLPDGSPCTPQDIASDACEFDLYPSDGSEVPPELIELCEARRRERDSCGFDNTFDDEISPLSPCERLRHELGEDIPCDLDSLSSDERNPVRSCNRDQHLGDVTSCLACNADSLDKKTKLKINIFLNEHRSPRAHHHNEPYPPESSSPYDTETFPDGNDIEYEFPNGGPIPSGNERPSSPGVPSDAGFEDGTISPAGIPGNRNSPSPQAQRPQPYDNSGLSSVGVPDDSLYNDGSMSSVGVPGDLGNQGSSPAPQPYNQSPPMSTGGSQSAPQPSYGQGPPPSSGGSYSPPPSYGQNPSPSSGGGGTVYNGQTPAGSSNTPFGHSSGGMSGKRKCRARYKVKSKGGERPDSPGHHGGGGQCGVVSRETITLLKNEEGFVASVSADPRGHGTIGYGHKCIQTGCAEVPYSQPLSEADGEKLMLEDLEVRF